MASHFHSRSGSTPANAGGANYPPPHSHSHSTTPQPAQPYSPDAQSTIGGYRSYGPQQDHANASISASWRSYDSPPPHFPSTYPPAAAPSSSGQVDQTWAEPPSGPLAHWSAHTQTPPTGTSPHSVLPALPTDSPAAPPTAKTPIISRLRNQLLGGRHPLSRTWEKASFAEECRTAPAVMESMPASGEGGARVWNEDRREEGGVGDVERGLEGRRREKKDVVNRGAMGEDAFSPSGRPVSLYASPAALRAFKPLPPHASMPGTPAQAPPRGLTSA